MTLQEYILERLIDYPITEVLNDGEYLDKQLDIKRVTSIFIDRANKNGSIKQYVKNDKAWNTYLDQYKQYFEEPAIIELDNKTYKVLDKTKLQTDTKSGESAPKDEVTKDEVQYDPDGNFDKLDQKSKDIITGRIFINNIVKYYAKLLKIVTEDQLIQSFTVTTDKEKDDNVALSILKIILIYMSQGYKPLLDIDILFGSNGKNQEDTAGNTINPDLIQIILYVFIMEDLKTAGLDTKLIGELQNYLTIE